PGGGRTFAPITSKHELSLKELAPGTCTVSSLVWGGLDNVGLTHWSVSPPYTGLCLAYYASGFDSAAVDHEADGSTNNGIFQINSRRWCKTLKEYTHKWCNMYCTELLEPDLKNSVICAMKISQQPQGLSSWETWRHHCMGKDLRDWVEGCND
ncbi:PREDICTED: sperm acrosome membrane-associated protein 3, partial [Miniopterus natalensis]|uniref:sperm acrosome membrane-associated protein 3 n=1 Tax=Miniopterus natalensis TaxID=291302 RepID=UPI0007A6CBE0